MEKERGIGEYERNAIAKSLQTVKKNLQSNLNNSENVNNVIDAMRMDIRDSGKRINGRFVIAPECIYEEEGIKYLIVNGIPYPEINESQTDVGYQIVNENGKDSVYIGEFINGKKEGHCIKYSEGGIFEGNFKNDEPINNYR